MTNEQIAGNLAAPSVSFERFREYILNMRNDEIVGICPYLPAAWYGFPHRNDDPKAEFIITQLKHILAHRGLTLADFVARVKRDAKKTA